MKFRNTVFALGWGIGLTWSVQASDPEIPLPSFKPLLELEIGGATSLIGVPAPKPGAGQEQTVRNGPANVCELPFAEFRQVPPVQSETGCGFQNAVVLTGLKTGSGPQVSLSSPVTVSCRFAALFSEWAAVTVFVAGEQILGSPIDRLVTGPGYQCRRRNNKPDGKLSEHALGRAVDVVEFRTRDGQTVSVEAHWSSDGKAGRFLKEVHRAACRKFTTVLGPDADPNHKSHFHLDTGCHGKDCTYLICQ